MDNYQNLIHRVFDLICDNASIGQNYILVGDNSSGKSEVLRKIVKKQLGQAIYFIDSVNRTFDVSKVQLLSKVYKDVKMESENVVSERIAPFNFNLQDTFKAMTCIELLYDKYSERIIAMCKAFLDKDIFIVREEIEAGLADNKILMNGTEIKLSSGYQAIIRIFCELLFFCDVMEAKNWGNGFVVIDEIDEYLSPKYSAKILGFLQNQFPNLYFLVTTHSIDLVKFSDEANLIVLRELTFEFYTNEDIKHTVTAEDIFTSVFFDDKIIHESNDDELDKKLRLFLNLKIAGLWDEKTKDEFKEMKDKEMQPVQKMIYKQIEEW